MAGGSEDKESACSVGDLGPSPDFLAWRIPWTEECLTRLTSLPGLLQLCIRLFTVSQLRFERHGKLKIFK